MYACVCVCVFSMQAVPALHWPVHSAVPGYPAGASPGTGTHPHTASLRGAILPCGRHCAVMEWTAATSAGRHKHGKVRIGLLALDPCSCAAQNSFIKTWASSAMTGLRRARRVGVQPVRYSAAGRAETERVISRVAVQALNRSGWEEHLRAGHPLWKGELLALIRRLLQAPVQQRKTCMDWNIGSDLCASPSVRYMCVCVCVCSPSCTSSTV